MAIYTAECDSCTRLFEATRADAETCSVACRVRRHRERVAASANAAALELLDLSQRQHDLFVRVSIDGFEAHAAEAERLAADLRRRASRAT